VRLLELFRTI